MYVTVKSRGFTVIELLIIVIIVAVLVCIVIPAIFAAKQKTRQIIYVNNLRQLFRAFEQYTNNNNGLLSRPNNSGTSKDGTKICNAEVWFKAVDRYLTVSQPPSERDEISLEERLLHVKQDPVFKMVSPSKQDRTRSIKMNQNLVPDSECQRYIETIEYPAKTVLLFDGRINNDGVADNFEGSYGSVTQRH